MPVIPTFADIARFIDRSAFVGGCLEWTGKPSKYGYGKIKVRGAVIWAHRFSYWLFNGPLIDGMQVHHKCHNTLCVNPSHLELLSHEENAAIKKAKSQW